MRPDVETTATAALVEAYRRALQGAHPVVTAAHLDRARQNAIQDPAQSLRDAGFVALD